MTIALASLGFVSVSLGVLVVVFYFGWFVGCCFLLSFVSCLVLGEGEGCLFFFYFPSLIKLSFS